MHNNATTIIDINYSSYTAEFDPTHMIVARLIGSFFKTTFNMPDLNRVPNSYCSFFRSKNEYFNFFSKEDTANKDLAEKNDRIIKGTCALFQDYSKKAWFHRWRHHTSLADTIVDRLKDENDTKTAVNYLIEVRQKLVEDPSTNLSGSMIRRLDFAITNLAQIVSEESDYNSTNANTFSQ